MKKQLIAGTAALAMASPAAVLADSGPEVYGFLNLSVDYEGYDHESDSSQDGDIGITNGLSHVGVRGSQGLDGGLSALYQIELGVKIAGDDDVGAQPSLGGGVLTQVRDSYVGLEGDFGTVTVGRQSFGNQFVYDGSFFVAQMGTPATATNLGRHGSRLDQMIRYAAPLEGPVGATFSVATSQGEEPGDHYYNARFTYDEGPLNGAFTVWQLDEYTSEGDVTIYSLGGKYDLGVLQLGAQVVGQSSDEDNADDNAYTFGAYLPVTAAGAIKTQITQFDADADDSDFTTVALAYEHSLSDRTIMNFTVASTSNDDFQNQTPQGYGHYGPTTIAADEVAADETHTGVSVGLRHSF